MPRFFPLVSKDFQDLCLLFTYFAPVHTPGSSCSPPFQWAFGLYLYSLFIFSFPSPVFASIATFSGPVLRFDFAQSYLTLPEGPVPPHLRKIARLTSSSPLPFPLANMKSRRPDSLPPQSTGRGFIQNVVNPLQPGAAAVHSSGYFFSLPSAHSPPLSPTFPQIGESASRAALPGFSRNWTSPLRLHEPGSPNNPSSLPPFFPPPTPL